MKAVDRCFSVKTGEAAKNTCQADIRMLNLQMIWFSWQVLGGNRNGNGFWPLYALL
jgi:hypothetical protein